MPWPFCILNHVEGESPKETVNDTVRWNSHRCLGPVVLLVRNGETIAVQVELIEKMLVC